PNKKIAILDRNWLPIGASTRNAGFACMGGLSELIADSKTMPIEEVLKLYSWRKKGLELLRARLGDNNIAYEALGSHELFSEKDEHHLEEIDHFNELLKPISGDGVFQKCTKNLISEFGFDDKKWSSVI